jgi:phenylalanyl-tRNA synthetase beta chain
MMEILARNNNFNNENARLYEMAKVYIPDAEEGKLPYEPSSLTVGLYGNCDFYTIKGIVEALASVARIKTSYVAESTDPSFHPGRCAKIYASDGSYLGILGQVHPTVAENYGFGAPVYVAELCVPALFAASSEMTEYKPLPKYPAVSRDFSFLCDEALEVGTALAVMSKAGGKLVEDVRLFDIYRGEKLGEGKKSVSIRVTLRAADRTLTQEDCDKASAKILAALEKELSLNLRS